MSPSIQVLEAGKHVLCEKPIALTTDEAKTLAVAGRQHPRLKLMEAFMYRFHSQWVWAQKMIMEGRIGDLRTVHSVFSFFDDGPDGILHHPEWGGDALMEVDEKCEHIQFDVCDHYGIQAELFSRCFIDDMPVPTPIDDAVANMKVIDAIVRSVTSNHWECVLNDQQDLTSASIAQGFSDQAHFCRTFKRMFGMSPKTRLKNSRFVQFLNPCTW